MGLDGLIRFCKENSIEYKLNEPMSCHTSFKIGGAADIFISVRSANELSAVFKKCGELNIPRFIIGKGSNLLVSDLGLEGAVISLAGLNGISVAGEEITCGAGAALSDGCRAALESSLTGLEFAYGIPGSIGGGISKEGDNLIKPIKVFLEGENYARNIEKNAEIKVAELGNDAGIIGAAYLCELYK